MTTEKRNLLHELHFPKERSSAGQTTMCQLKMQLNCCQGLGYLLDSEGAFTRAKICTCVKGCLTCGGEARYLRDNKSVLCKKPNPRVITNLYNLAGIPSRYATAKLDSFNNFSGNGQEMVGKIKQWHAQYKKGSKGLLIEGPVGVGKTYLLAALAREFLMKGQSVKFVDFFQLLSELKAGYANKKAEDSLLKPLMNVDILIIDEMGKGRNNDWELSIIDQMVMGRYNQNKTILASTNYSMRETKQLINSNAHLDLGEGKGFRENQFEQSVEDRVGTRTFSRLIDMCYFVKLTGDDYRRKLVMASKGRPAT